MHDDLWPRSPRRLARSTRDRMWAGVAGGLAEYFDIDPTLMRLIWVVATVVTAGLFVPVYIVMWFIMPRDVDRSPSGWDKPPEGESQPVNDAGSVAADAAGWGSEAPPRGWRRHERHDPWHPEYHHRRRRSAGVALVVLGAFFLCAQAGVFRWINGGVVWALVLIALGGALLLRNSDSWRF